MPFIHKKKWCPVNKLKCCMEIRTKTFANSKTAALWRCLLSKSHSTLFGFCIKVRLLRSFVRGQFRAPASWCKFQRSPARCDSTASSQNKWRVFLVEAVPGSNPHRGFPSHTLSVSWSWRWSSRGPREGCHHGDSSPPSDPSGSLSGLEPQTGDSTEHLCHWQLS